MRSLIIAVEVKFSFYPSIEDWFFFIQYVLVTVSLPPLLPVTHHPPAPHFFCLSIENKQASNNKLENNKIK